MSDDWRHLLAEAAGRCGGDGRLWAHFVNGLSEPVRRRLLEEWQWQAHGGQAEPPGDWTVWTLMAGRGFGKTRAGAEWVWARVRERAGTGDMLLRVPASRGGISGTLNRDVPEMPTVPLRIALVGATREDPSG